MNQHSMKVAVVGCGAISDIYIENMISKFSILDVVACCDTKNELAQAKAEKFNLKVLAIEEIIKDESIEIVVNLTPPIKHYSIIKEMLNANKHVYTEKIMTLHVNEAQELVELAEMKQIYLGSAPDTFLGSALQNSKHLLD
ncbi:Gfo/Idh/MocA family protein [Enterococcus sp. LJL120]